MKKFILTFILFIVPIFFTNCFGADTITVKVPLNLSAIGLKCMGSNNVGDTTAASAYYTCTIDAGFASVGEGIGKIIKYFTFITGLAGVLFIIINGIMLSMAGLNQGLKEKARTNIQKTLFGLVILLLSGVILNFIAPWIYQ